MRGALPLIRRSLRGCSLSLVSCPAGSPLIRVEFARSLVLSRVVETTSLGVLMCAATGSSVPVLSAQKGTNFW
jgi:hypothetical protein